jgi:2-polyprenyl-3-methyl-5-hydroxy-6-metoxy-1,4-benzoquinol methylase
MDKWLNQDWTETFENRQWHRDGGNYHSLSWMAAVLGQLAMLPETANIFNYARWEVLRDGKFRYNTATIHDYGCAEGDGTMYLKCVFPFASVKGIDFHPKAIELAKERWTSHDITWEVGDVTDPAECDILTCTQTMDHVDDIPSAINRCIDRSKVFIMSWADISWNKDHPSQDLTWAESVPPLTVAHSFLKPRIVRDTGQIIKDIIQLFVWTNDLRIRD